MNLPQRKHPRLKQYDYSAPGSYFVTICAKDRRCIFSEIVERGPRPGCPAVLTPPDVQLTDIGQIVEQYIRSTEQVYAGVTVDKYVIMPNHVHILLTIHSPQDGGVRAPRPTVPMMIRAIKSMVTREAGGMIWQTSFYDHVVRDEVSYQEIWQYIDENPRRWQKDELYVET